MDMRKEYDFTNAKPNPYVKKMLEQISTRLDIDTITHTQEELEAGYKAMANDEEYEREAMEWCNGLMNGIDDETR